MHRTQGYHLWSETICSWRCGKLGCPCGRRQWWPSCHQWKWIGGMLLLLVCCSSTPRPSPSSVWVPSMVLLFCMCMILHSWDVKYIYWTFSYLVFWFCSLFTLFHASVIVFPFVLSYPTLFLPLLQIFRTETFSHWYTSFERR